MKITPEQIRNDLYKAYEDAKKHKRNTLAQLDFEDVQETDLEQLYEELVTRYYEPLPAYSFITFDPVQREVFASQFRDRVVQHMLYNYLAPLFDTLLIEDTYSCRVGKGTHFGMMRFEHHLRSVTDNYTQEAYVLLFDLSGYFMSIDKSLLMGIIRDEINHHLDRKSPDGRLWGERIDPDFCDFLIHVFFDRNPATNCIRIGRASDWNGLPPNKRLSCSPPGFGLVIGDIDSQLFSNMLLNITDQWAKRQMKLRHWGHYVDDHFVMHNSLLFLQKLEPVLIETFKEKIHVDVHPHKIHYTPANGANLFLGGYIRPFYKQPRQRTIDKFVATARTMEYRLLCCNPSLNELEQINRVINSYCGIFSHFKAYNLRKKYLDTPAYNEYFIFNEWMTKAKLRYKYRKTWKYYMDYFV